MAYGKYFVFYLILIIVVFIIIKKYICVLKRKCEVVKMNKAKYSAVDVARYVVNYSWEIGSPISNLKLQKILYLIQGNFLRILNTPCFKDEIEAWRYGPVVPEVYREFKNFGSNYIGKIEYYIDLEKDKYEPISKKFDFHVDGDEKRIIDDVVEACKDFSSSYLVELTHNQSPWIKTFRKYDKTIDLETMKEYFCNE